MDAPVGRRRVARVAGGRVETRGGDDAVEEGLVETGYDKHGWGVPLGAGSVPGRAWLRVTGGGRLRQLVML